METARASDSRTSCLSTSRNGRPARCLFAQRRPVFLKRRSDSSPSLTPFPSRASIDMTLSPTRRPIPFRCADEARRTGREDGTSRFAASTHRIRRAACSHFQLCKASPRHGGSLSARAVSHPLSPHFLTQPDALSEVAG